MEFLLQCKKWYITKSWKTTPSVNFIPLQPFRLFFTILLVSQSKHRWELNVDIQYGFHFTRRSESEIVDDLNIKSGNAKYLQQKTYNFSWEKWLTINWKLYSIYIYKKRLTGRWDGVESIPRTMQSLTQAYLDMNKYTYWDLDVIGWGGWW